LILGAIENIAILDDRNVDTHVYEFNIERKVNDKGS